MDSESLFCWPRLGSGELQYFIFQMLFRWRNIQCYNCAEWGHLATWHNKAFTKVYHHDNLYAGFVQPSRVFSLNSTFYGAKSVVVSPPASSVFYVELLPYTRLQSNCRRSLSRREGQRTLTDQHGPVCCHLVDTMAVKEGQLDSARCECKYWVESLVVVNVEIMTNCLQLLNNLQIAVSWTGVSQPLSLKGSNWV